MVKEIDDFVREAIERMNVRPTKLQDILVFNQNFIEINMKKREMQEQTKKAENLNRLIRSITGQGVNLSGLESRWQNFDSIINSFSDMMQEQREMIKKELNNKVSDINQELEKFYSKWTAIKPADNLLLEENSDIKEIAEEIKKVFADWDIQERTVNLTIEECKNFEIEIPVINSFDKIKEEIVDNKQKWRIYFDYVSEQEKFAKEEWLGIRNKAFGILQDFTLVWGDKIKKKQRDFIVIYINNNLELLKQSLNVYKYMIGENFERDHWKSLFNILKLDNSITKETLIFGNFIEKSTLLIKKSSEIKDLYARSQGEILIRNAISELASWFEIAEFQFTEYVNNNRK
jgi:dynein heavy chain 2